MFQQSADCVVTIVLLSCRSSSLRISGSHYLTAGSWFCRTCPTNRQQNSYWILKINTEGKIKCPEHEDQTWNKEHKYNSSKVESVVTDKHFGF